MKLLFQLFVMGAVGLFGCGSKCETRRQPNTLMTLIPGAAPVVTLSISVLSADPLAPTWSHSR